MLRNAVTEVKIDNTLVRNASIRCHALEIGDNVFGEHRPFSVYVPTLGCSFLLWGEKIPIAMMASRRAIHKTNRNIGDIAIATKNKYEGPPLNPGMPSK